MFDPTNYPAGVYNDTIPPESGFSVVIKPMGPDFRREDYIVDEDEFTIGGIIGDIGEGDDIVYEVQFRDDRTAMVSPHYSHPFSNPSDNCTDLFSYLLTNYFAIRTQKGHLKSTKHSAKVIVDQEDNAKKRDPSKFYPTPKKKMGLTPHLMKGRVNDAEPSFAAHTCEAHEIPQDRKPDQPGREDLSPYPTGTMLIRMTYLIPQPRDVHLDSRNGSHRYDTTSTIFQRIMTLTSRP